MQSSYENPPEPVPATGLAKAWKGLLDGTGAFAALLFMSMALLVCADVLLRNVSSMSIGWSVEVTEYMLMVAAFCAAPWLVYTNDHIRVDVIVRGFTGVPRFIVSFISYGICLFISVVLGWYSYTSLMDAVAQGGIVFKVLMFPEWWLGLPMLVSFVLLIIEFTRQFAGIFTRSKGA
ncbi:MAG: TRAP transporter small permease [Pusillimonas sp.]